MKAHEKRLRAQFNLDGPLPQNADQIERDLSRLLDDVERLREQVEAAREYLSHGAITAARLALRPTLKPKVKR